MPFENLKRMKPDVTHLHVFGCGTYVFLLEEVCVNKLNPKSELMIFLGYPQGTKGYLFMRGPNNVLFTAVQALFDETLSLKCPDMHHPRYTPVAPPVDAQGEYNIPPEDNENGDHGGAPFAPAPPGIFMPPRAPLPRSQPKNQGKGQNLMPRFHLNQPLQGRLLLSQNLMISMSLRHVPQDLHPEIWTPCMDFLILIQDLVTKSMMRN